MPCPRCCAYGRCPQHFPHLLKPCSRKVEPRMHITPKSTSKPTAAMAHILYDHSHACGKYTHVHHRRHAHTCSSPCCASAASLASYAALHASCSCVICSCARCSCASSSCVRACACARSLASFSKSTCS